MSLRLRILLLIAAVNVGVLLVIVQVGLDQGRADTSVPTAAVNQAVVLARTAIAEGPPAKLEAGYIGYVVVVAEWGSSYEWIGTRGEQPVVERARDRLLARVAERRTEAARGIETLLTATGLTYIGNGAAGQTWAGVFVGFNERAAFEARAGLRRTYVVLSAGTIFLIGATYLFLRALVLGPLKRLEEASRAVEQGAAVQHDVPVPRGGGEMARLIENFNRMASEVHEYQAHLEDRVIDTLQRVTAAERRLVVAQRLAATGTLAAGFAHEINNPVGGILNAVRRLRQGGLTDERREEYFELVQDGVDRIRTIVERILHFTPRDQEPGPVDVAEVCRRAVALASHRAEVAHVQLDLELEGPLDGVVGDAQELTQAVLNLIFNAIDAIPAERDGTVHVRAWTDDDELRIDVEDDGVGMDGETAQRCVDLFFSTKPEGEGTGLGLGIVQHIVIDHGGSIDIASTPEKGTTVRIRLARGMSV